VNDRLDLLVVAVAKIIPVHERRYWRNSSSVIYPRGVSISFNSVTLKHGIVRKIASNDVLRDLRVSA